MLLLPRMFRNTLKISNFSKCHVFCPLWLFLLQHILPGFPDSLVTAEQYTHTGTEAHVHKHVQEHLYKCTHTSMQVFVHKLTSTCMYTCIHTCTCMLMHVYAHEINALTHISTSMHMHTHQCMHNHTHVNTHMHTHMHCMSTSIHAQICMGTHKHVHAHTSGCEHSHTHVHTQTHKYMCAYSYTCTHTHIVCPTS